MSMRNINEQLTESPRYYTCIRYTVSHQTASLRLYTRAKMCYIHKLALVDQPMKGRTSRLSYQCLSSKTLCSGFS